MLLPTTSTGVMIVIALAAVLWGLWVSTTRIDRKWRYELYAFDFAFGAVAGALVLAYTAGNSGASNTFTFDDNLTIAGKRAMATAAAAGMLFCLGNLLLLAGVSLGGMSTALPVAAGVSLLVGAAIHGGANAGMVWGGVGLGLAAVGIQALAQRAGEAANPPKKGMYAGWKALILSAAGGLVLGAFPVIGEWSRVGDLGVGAYGTVVFASVGLLLATPLLNIFFMNLPVQGQPIGYSAYLQGTVKQHLAGVAGGLLWAGGAVAFFAAAGTMATPTPKFLTIVAGAAGSAVVAGLIGLAVWGEQGGSGKAKGLAALSLLVLGAGLALAAAGA